MVGFKDYVSDSRSLGYSWIENRLQERNLTFGDIYWNCWSVCRCVGPVEKFEDVIESHGPLVAVIEKYPDLKKGFNIEMSGS